MRALFDVSHPAHVHLFRNAISQLDADGHQVLVTSRKKDLTTTLLDAYGIAHTPISQKGQRKHALVTEWTGREIRLLWTALTFDPDVIVSRLNPPAAHASVLAGCPSIVFDDSERAQLVGRITHPFADVVCTPSGFGLHLGERQDTYDGFHELAYLHPNQFEPDPDALRVHGVEPDDPYVVLRFVSWGAHHDVGQRGLSGELKRRLVSTLAEEHEVYISSERPLPEEFEAYRLPIPPHEMHDLLYHANLYVGDSQTMATEAAILGTPAVRSNSFVGEQDMSNFVELEETYGLLYSYPPADVLPIVQELLDDEDVRQKWAQRRDHLLQDKIDVTEYMLDKIQQVTIA